MPCKKTILLVLLSCALQPGLFCDDVGPVRQSIQPPVIESKIGYLTALSDLDIDPDTTRIFIAPQTRLPIMQDSGDFYYFLVRIDISDVCCKIPKYQKYMILMEPSKDKAYMYFRGGIEAEIVPFLISSGEEMPIISSNDNYFFVAVRRRGLFNATIKIPKDSKGVSISKESAFAKLSVEQKKKGLEYFNGSWMTPAKAQELRNSQLDKETLKQKRWDALKKQAGAGVLVLKDGRIIHGTYRGCDKVSILFECGGDTRQYGVDDVADISIEKAVSMGNLDSAATLVVQARSRMDEYPGHARRFLEQAQSSLIKVNPSFTDLMGRTMDLGAQVKSMNEGIDSSLKKKNLALYNYEVFPAALLDYHLKAGHILAGKSWINPDQLCKRCSGGGEISCAKCQATGKVNKKCPKCDNGRISCHLCEGSGYKVCNICGGLGEFLRTCTRCGGSGVTSGYYTYPCGGPYLYLSSGAVMVVGTVSPFYYYPYYTTRTCPVCNGTGRMSTVCSYCGGIGKMVCPKTEKCDLCNGVGFTKVMCPDCEGRGKITCPDCKGKGFSGAAQKAPGEDAKSPAPSGAAPASGGKSQTMVP